MTNNAISAGALLSSKRVREKKQCPVCNNEFVGIKKAIYCSNKCRQQAKYKRKKSESI